MVEFQTPSLHSPRYRPLWEWTLQNRELAYLIEATDQGAFTINPQLENSDLDSLKQEFPYVSNLEQEYKTVLEDPYLNKEPTWTVENIPFRPKPQETPESQQPLNQPLIMSGIQQPGTSHCTPPAPLPHH